MCRNLVAEKMHFSRGKKQSEKKVIECDGIDVIEEAYKDECTIGSLEEFSWMWFSKEIAGTAGDDDSCTPSNTSKTCINVDNVIIKL